MSKLGSTILTILAFLAISVNFATSIKNLNSDLEWTQYKQKYGKDYTNAATTEAYAHYYYKYNKRLIDKHNAYYARGLRTFGLQVNQFTDMRLVSFNALFPLVTQPTHSNAVPLPETDEPKPDKNFDPAEDLGFNITVEDQGTVCNSGWAYATAKAVELLQAYQTANMEPVSLSAQNLIDCAGRSAGCSNQVPQTGFDYLTQHKQELHTSGDYLNNKTQAQQGMCILPSTSSVTTTLSSYARINDGDDATLRRYVPNYPVVIEFNPTSFEFMHYSEGIFQQPATFRGSHFMTVVGYGTNTTANLDYFILQNSFNTTWGENGRIRIAYTAAKPLTKSAILPVQL